MSQPMPRQYSAAFKERAVKLAVESEQLIAQTARDLGINENTLHTWIGKYHLSLTLGQRRHSCRNASVLIVEDTRGQLAIQRQEPIARPRNAELPPQAIDN